MRVMVIVKATKRSEAGIPPSPELLTEMGKFNDELISAGVMLTAGGLHPSSKGKRVRIAEDGRTVIDGPFEEAKDLISGYWILQLKSMEEAVAWVQRCPNPMPGEVSELEIRPFFEAEDFGEALSPELRAQQERQCTELNQQAKAEGNSS